MARGVHQVVRVLAEERYVVTVYGCWEAVGTRLGTGYIQLSSGGRRDLAHRMAWAEANGPIPPGMLVCHRCDNPPCCRPDHLFLGTPADNMADMVAKGRGRAQFGRGEEHPSAKLNADLVREIRGRLANGETQQSIADAYGVTLTAISAIALGRNWAWVQ